MLSCRRDNSGFSLTEVLVVLAILALAVAVFASTRPGPSPAMLQEARFSTLIADAARSQQAAIIHNTTQSYAVQELTCSQNPQSFVFFADGTALETEICLKNELGDYWIAVDPFTGQVKRITAP